MEARAGEVNRGSEVCEVVLQWDVAQDGASRGAERRVVCGRRGGGSSSQIEWERKKGMLKGKNGSIDVDSVSSVQNVAGTNKFVIEGDKWE